MPVYFLGALTMLICAIAVWASFTEDTDATSYSDEYEPAWEPFEELQEYRKASWNVDALSPPHTGHFSSFQAISQNIHSYLELIRNACSIRFFSS